MRVAQLTLLKVLNSFVANSSRFSHCPFLPSATIFLLFSMAMAMAGLLLLLLFWYRLDLLGCGCWFPVNKTVVGSATRILELRYGDKDGCFDRKACAKMIQLPIVNSCSTTRSLVMLQNAILLVTTLHNSAALRCACTHYFWTSQSNAMVCRGVLRSDFRAEGTKNNVQSSYTCSQNRAKKILNKVG